MEIISVWNKRPSKWVKRSGDVRGKPEYIRMPVHLPYGQKMAMCLVTDPKTGKKVTRHLPIDA